MLVHFHPTINAISGVVKYDDILLPQVFECTYLHKKFVNKLELNDTELPIDIDIKNVPTQLFIDYQPFVFKQT